ncbi:uncharacterized protein dpr15 [Eurosta solidaginis]|uniref:uncharacterized protein dpr15 n=1 Tax=Eurosta solidaginis TaxID=178769 RepID=UPI003531495B
MDSKKMRTLNWMILFVLLMLVPGSTLNVIESAAITTTAKSFASIPKMTTTTTKTTSTTKTLPTGMATKIFALTLNEESFTTTVTALPLTMNNDTNASNIHSINSKEAGCAGTAGSEITTKSSIIEFIKAAEATKQRDESNIAKNDRSDSSKAVEATIAIDDIEFGCLKTTTKRKETFATTLQADFTETKATKTAANMSRSSAQVTTTTKQTDMTMKRTKAAFNCTQTHEKLTSGGSATGERDARIAGSRFDSTKVDMPTAEARTIVTPVTIVGAYSTIPTALSSTQNDVTTKASLATATPTSTVQLLATTLWASTSRDEYTEQNYRNFTKGINALAAESNHNNKVSNYSYNQTAWNIHANDENDKSKIDIIAGRKNLSSSYHQRRGTQQRQTNPLPRPKVQKSNNDSNGDINNNYNYLYNSNNNYFSNQQQQLLQHQPRPQYARQVQQKQHYHIAAMMPLATSSTTAAIFPAFGNNLIHDKYAKLNDANLNKSKATKYENKQKLDAAISHDANNMSLTTMEINSGSTVVGQTTAAMNEHDAGNTATNASAFPTVTTTTMKSTTRRPPPTTTPRPTPSIDDYQTVISQAGTHAYLPCNVKHLVKKPISWLRVRDGHILTVDQTTFIADQRFQSIYASNPERWSLQIKYVQLKDEGTYECQVSTEPKSSAIVTLRVVEPRTELIGEPTRHVKAGSQVKLRCIISQALEPPLFINWFHNQKQIYLHSRRDWRTEIERIELPLTDPSTTTTKTTRTTTVSTTTKPTREQIEEAPTTVLKVNAAATTATSATTRTNDFDSDTLKGEAETYIQQNGTGVATVTGKGMTIATTTSTISLVNAPTHGSFAVGFGNGNTILPLLAAMVPAAVTTSTAMPTITKIMRWPATTKTTSITLAAVEVRQITTASLIIPSVEKQDSGNYTCSPSNSAPKTVVLHVLNGEYSASAITSGVSSKKKVGDQYKWVIAFLTLFVQHWHHKLTAFIILMKIIASALQRYIVQRVQGGRYVKAAEATTPTFDNVATTNNNQPLTNFKISRQMSKKFLCSSSAQKQCETCHLTGDWSYNKKYNKNGPLLIGHGNIIGESNGINCDDECRNVGSRVEKALHLLATKEKT